MKDIEIYYDVRQAKKRIILGVLSFCLGGLFFVLQLYFSTRMQGGGYHLYLYVLGIGSTLFLLGRDALSNKPQLILKEKGLYVAYDKNKLIPWRAIQGFKITEEENETTNMLKNNIVLNNLVIRSRIKVDALFTVFSEEFPVQNLMIKRSELLLLLKTYKKGEEITLKGQFPTLNKNDTYWDIVKQTFSFGKRVRCVSLKE